MLQRCPYCESIVCHAYGLRTVDISVRLKWLQGKIQSLVAFSAEKQTHAADFLKRRIEEFEEWIFEGFNGVVIFLVQESKKPVIPFVKPAVLGAEKSAAMAEVARLGRRILTNTRCTLPAPHLYG